MEQRVDWSALTNQCAIPLFASCEKSGIACSLVNGREISDNFSAVRFLKGTKLTMVFFFFTSQCVLTHRVNMFSSASL